MLVAMPFEELERGVHNFFDVGAIGRFAGTDLGRPDSGQQRKRAQKSRGVRRTGFVSAIRLQIANHCHFCAIYSRAVFPIMDTTGQVAQLVEHRTENPGVGGSIPPLSILAALVSKGISLCTGLAV